LTEKKAKTKQILSCAAAKQFGVHKKQLTC